MQHQASAAPSYLIELPQLENKGLVLTSSLQGLESTYTVLLAVSPYKVTIIWLPQSLTIMPRA
jgi:hypothetical protein